MAKRREKDDRPLHERAKPHDDGLTQEQRLTLARAGQAYGHHRGLPGHKATDYLRAHPPELAALGQSFVDLAAVLPPPANEAPATE